MGQAFGTMRMGGRGLRATGRMMGRMGMSRFIKGMAILGLSGIWMKG